MLVTMKAILDRASKENYAVAAPNVSTELDARACIQVAEELNSPLILDVAYPSNPDIFFFGHMLRDLATMSSVPVCINLDHGGEKYKIMQAIQAGFTSVMIDRSSEPDEVNIAETKDIVEIAHGCGVSVEAELGHVGQASQYDIDRDAALTAVDQAKGFVEATGVDCLAVAVGTAHGFYPEGFTPYLDFDRLAEIKASLGQDFPLVLHGSSGTDDESLKKACSMGINKVNIATDLNVAALRALREANLEDKDARMLWKTAIDGFKDKLRHMMKDVYGSENKAWPVTYGLSTKGIGVEEEK